MNDYSLNLKGILGIFKSKLFYKPKASEKERTFVCEGGSGLSPQVGTSRKITGHWESDGARDTISSYDLECIFVKGEKIKAPITAFTGDEPKPTPVVVLEVELEEVPQKKVRRKK